MSLKLTEPKCLAQFFVQGTRVLVGQDHLRRLNLNNVIGQSLLDGIETFQAKDESMDVHLDVIIQNCPRDRLLNANIVTWRGILTAIMCHPYSNQRDDVECFHAMCLDGIVYIEHDKESQRRRQSDPKFTYFGFRFETIAMENMQSRTKDTVTNNTVEWTHLISSSIDDLTLIYGAEIDGISDDPNQELVELKTSKAIDTDRDQFIFMKHKLMKTWAQSYLANVPNIVYGFRDEHGTICDVKRYRLHDIPGLAREGGWDPKVMLRYLKDYLTQVKRIVSFQPGTVFKVTLDPTRKESSPIITETSLPPFVQL